MAGGSSYAVLASSYDMIRSSRNKNKIPIHVCAVIKLSRSRLCCCASKFRELCVLSDVMSIKEFDQSVYWSIKYLLVWVDIGVSLCP